MMLAFSGKTQAFILALCFLLTPTFCLAKEATLADVQQRLAKPTAIHGLFRQEKKLTILQQPLVSNGQFWLAQEQGLVWQTQSPIASELIISPKGMQFSEQLSGNMERSMQHISQIFNALLSADFSALEKQFDITSCEILDDNSWRLTLSPQSLLIKKALAEITITGSATLHGIVLSEASGDSTSINISQVESFSQIPAVLINKLNQSQAAP